ncbi:MAG: 5-formyltetrahydrofolate cyclo-ligase [Candidatus Sedimenticola endophacoides]|uniref:5-formyltetrahydrofolate cyclo-ligase n=1 Tax=Candidatus Sedimenticola endophacoides TaxID=2548426 RepID=A0A6N4DTJ1_9GAMM|nr:MAG: 5-formyltetrahydrofolate cyclo-ligase [Candidatus Sedimenticola endophacoides]PUE03260.1 MAG: 5-formyltetrahydrofolate cyclo-ligase [Candidatus Sedimenticola endophacoides]PUE03796.1 MAG: 5-formyltetrahydrofolate cyclo-ligase [Candidatus Sedimenticola endophacoides]
MTDPKRQRNQIRSLRRALSPGRQRAHARAAARNFHASPLFLKARHIALYLASDGELDPQIIARQALACGKKVYLPVLRPQNRRALWFAPYRPGQRLINNRFNIPEPDIRSHKPRRPWALDLILMPLVAFDLGGNRLGMGGGYYDRTFAYLRHRRVWKRPRLAGLAHELQRLDTLSANPWDIPMQAVITEQAYHPCGGRAGPTENAQATTRMS